MTKAAVPILLLTSLAWTVPGRAQTADPFEKAPPGVEEALRERVNGFYKTWEDGKFRAGEKFVSDESQELYYQIQKQKLEKCEIIRIRYERDFNDAIVTISCKGKMNIQGEMLDMVMAHSDFWTLEKDQWVWTVKPVQKMDTPFGTLNYGNFEGTNGLFNPDTGIPKDAKSIGVLGDKIMQQGVTADKTEVMLSSFEKATAVVTIKNGINGYIDVRADSEHVPRGFTATWDTTKIKAFGEAKLTLTYDPNGDVSAKEFAWVRIYVEQFPKLMFPVHITFAIPEAVQKMFDRPKPAK